VIGHLSLVIGHWSLVISKGQLNKGQITNDKIIEMGQLEVKITLYGIKSV
jgi:hypothetical protein